MEMPLVVDIVGKTGEHVRIWEPSSNYGVLVGQGLRYEPHWQSWRGWLTDFSAVT